MLERILSSPSTSQWTNYHLFAAAGIEVADKGQSMLGGYDLEALVVYADKLEWADGTAGSALGV